MKLLKFAASLRCDSYSAVCTLHSTLSLHIMPDSHWRLYLSPFLFFILGTPQIIWVTPVATFERLSLSSAVHYSSICCRSFCLLQSSHFISFHFTSSHFISIFYSANWVRAAKWPGKLCRSAFNGPRWQLKTHLLWPDVVNRWFAYFPPHPPPLPPKKWQWFMVKSGQRRKDKKR